MVVTKMNVFFSLFIIFFLIVAQLSSLLKRREELLSSPDPVSHLPTKISVSPHNFGGSLTNNYLQTCQSSAAHCLLRQPVSEF